jgi:replicative DNA helicase
MALATQDNRQTPPHDQEAEQSVLGAVLIDPSSISMASEHLNPKHFYYKENRLIFENMLELFQANEPIDILTLSSQLKKRKAFKDIGGRNYLSQLLEVVPTSANIEQYAKVVKDSAIKRELISLGSNLVRQAFKEEGSTKELLNLAERDVFALSQESVRRQFIPVRDLLTSSYEQLEKIMKSKGEMRGLPTGFGHLDNKLAGLNPSNLIIIAARPGIGKTTFALNIASHLCLEEKKTVGFFSLEMSKEELVDRLLVMEAKIDSWKLKTGKLNDEEMTKLTQAYGRLADANLFIDYTPALSITEMRTKARKLQIEKKLDMIIMDYIQLADPGRRTDSRVQEVSYISQGLKNIARELQLPVIALSQLSRAVEQRGEKRPQLADLRDSGAIEQDADIVMFLYRVEEDDELLPEGKRTIKCSLAKHRSGPTGDFDFIFKANELKFYEIEAREEGLV